MTFAIFAAPLLSDNAFRMVEAAATLDGVKLGVITHDDADRLRHLQDRVAHWRVTSIPCPINSIASSLRWSATSRWEYSSHISLFSGSMSTTFR
jgi:hypothetical protein